MKLESFVEGSWIKPDGPTNTLHDASTGIVVAEIAVAPAPAAQAYAYARRRGVPSLGALTFHERAGLLKRLGLHLLEHKQELYELSYATGATLRDSGIDIDGGAGTLLSYASKGRRELPVTGVVLDGPAESLGKLGTFSARHIYTPLQGVALQINAFNFPVWGMLEKFAPAFLAGVPTVVKPASQTGYLTELAVRLMVGSGLLPEGSLQLLLGGTDGLLDGLGVQDMVSFTGSAGTASRLRQHSAVVNDGVRFNAEADSLNAAVLGPDADPSSPEFELFVREIVREMTAKSGQKCTAIRRAFVPREHVDAVSDALVTALAKIQVGDPRDPETRMGPVVSQFQKQQVLSAASAIAAAGKVICGEPTGSGGGQGAFVDPVLIQYDDASIATVHNVEAFGPVATLLPYDQPGHLGNLLGLGQGSLVASIVSHDRDFVAGVVRATAPMHGRLHILDRDCAKESTGHGSPLPTLVHGGPGRAGGGEELGGMRAVLHHMQRTAIQGSPAMLTAITGTYTSGSPTSADGTHPFRKNLQQLRVGDSVRTAARTITLEDIAHFATFTGDTFYAHTDEQAAAANPLFGGIVAHGYLVLSFAAGLFVDPAPGPVLANTGLERLRFTKPVKAGDSITAILTCSSITPRSTAEGEVRWDVRVLDQEETLVATYELLTMVSAK